MTTKTRSVKAKTKPAAEIDAADDDGDVELKCRVCGCTEVNGCDGGCSWVIDADLNSELDLCSRCVGRGGPNGAPLVGVRCADCGVIVEGGLEPGLDACPCCEGDQLEPLTERGSTAAMGAAVAEKRSAKQKTSPAKPDAARQVTLVPIAAIAANPKNPRETFDEGALTALMNGISTDGLLSPVLLRPDGDGFELIAGERRLRACEALGWPEIPAFVVPLDDVAAARACVTENTLREQLNPLEQAAALKLLSDAGLSQSQIAKEAGISQGEVSKLLRLTELPEPFRSMVISRDMPPRHAQELLPWLGHEKILAAVAESLAESRRRFDMYERDAGREWEFPSLREFASTVSRAVTACTKPVRGSYMPAKLTPALEKELDVREVRSLFGGTEKRAFNVSAANRLVIKAKKAAANKLNSETGPAGHKTAGAKAQPAIPGPRVDHVERQLSAWLAGRLAEQMKTAKTEAVQRVLLVAALGMFDDDGFASEFIAGPQGTKFSVLWPRLLSMSQAQFTAEARGWLVKIFENGSTQSPNRGWRTVLAFEPLRELFTAFGGDLGEFRVCPEDLEIYDHRLLLEMPGVTAELRSAVDKKKKEVDKRAVLAVAIAGSADAKVGGWLPEEFTELVHPPAKKPARGKAKPR